VVVGGVGDDETGSVSLYNVGNLNKLDVLLYSIRFRLWQIERSSLANLTSVPSRVSVDYLTDSETQPRPFIVDDGGFAPVISEPVISAPGIFIYLAPSICLLSTRVPWDPQLRPPPLHRGSWGFG
jgi:hypothetical protein